MGAPVKHTCPDIDAMQKFLNQAINIIDFGTLEDLSSKDIGNCIDEIEKVKDGLEELRTANSQLRGWGEDEEDKNAKLEDRVDELEDRIKDLEKENQALENRIKSLEIEIEMNIGNEDPVF